MKHVTFVEKTRQAVQVQRNTEARTYYHCCSEKAFSITYFECVFVVLGTGMQCACAIILYVTCPTVQYFAH